MKINSTKPNTSSHPMFHKPSKAESALSAVIEGSDSFQGAVTGGVVAAVPALGALSLGVRGGGAAIAAGITNNEDTERLASAALLGTMANVAGTLTMIGGALTGNQTAMNVSFGLLGCSALAGVYVGAKIG